jgi:hypothetical protein
MRVSRAFFDKNLLVIGEIFRNLEHGIAFYPRKSDDLRTKATLAICSGTLLLFFWVTAARSQGTSGFEILRVQSQARGAALGGALIADAGSIEDAFFNPAGLAMITTRSATAGYMNYLLDIDTGYLTYVSPIIKYGVWGANLNYTNYGKFNKRSATGENLGEFSANDFVFGLSYANKVQDKLSLGGNAKFVSSRIDAFKGSAMAFDFGAQYRLIPDRLVLGAGMFNLGWTTHAYIGYRDHLPFYYKIGVKGMPTGFPANLYFNVTINQEYADNYSLKGFNGGTLFDFLGQMYYSVGAEFHPMDALYLRVGYDTKGLDQKVGTSKDALAGICGGFGLDMNIISFDYGLASYGELGMVQRVSLSTKFGK